MTPEQATTILNALALPLMQAEHPLTKSVIDAIPVEKCDYCPDPVGRSAIELAWHIVMAECRFMDAVLKGEFDLSPRPRPETVRSPADVNAWYEERFARNLEQLKSLPAEQLVKPIDFRGRFQFPAVIYLQLGLTHSIHHRGQLSTYLRPMGAKVPSIYGESYDARQVREAAEAAQATQA